MTVNKHNITYLYTAYKTYCININLNLNEQQYYNIVYYCFTNIIIAIRSVQRKCVFSLMTCNRNTNRANKTRRNLK